MKYYLNCLGILIILIGVTVVVLVAFSSDSILPADVEAAEIRITSQQFPVEKMGWSSRGSLTRGYMVAVTETDNGEDAGQLAAGK